MKKNDFKVVNFSVNNKASSNEADILIYDQIGEYFDWNTWDTAGVTYKSFEEEFNKIKDSKKINIRVNSAGGDVHMGLSIYNFIQRNLDKNIHIYVDSVAYSMAAIITQAVKKENRHIAKNAMLMLHSASTTIYGQYNASQLLEMVNVMNKYDEILAISLADTMGMTKEDILAKYFNGDDHYFTPEEAVSIGLMNDIIDNVPVNNSLEEERKSIFAELNDLKSIINKFFNPKKPESMNLDQVINDLKAGNISNEVATQLASKLETFNTAKITNEELEAAVASKEAEVTTAKDAVIQEKEAEIQNLKSQIDAKAINNGGNPPANATDAPIDLTDEDAEFAKRMAFKPVQFH